ncbi:MAG: glutaminyl-peptide cyclotransferase [Terricaulis sp.]
MRSLLVIAALLFSVPAYAQAPAIYGYRVVHTYPHDRDAFTQGLFFRDGFLYESTGLNGHSSIRKVALATGRVLRQHDIDAQYFGEGIVDWGDRIVAITWRSQRGFVFGLHDFEPRASFAYEGEGWGLTRDTSRIIMSDGGDRLRFLDPNTLQQTGEVPVTLQGRPLRNLNELEWVEGAVLANIWQTNWIARIDPASGAVTGLIDLRGLLPPTDFEPGHTDVLNGIAYDPATRRMFVTGKNWPKLFEIELVEQPAFR